MPDPIVRLTYLPNGQPVAEAAPGDATCDAAAVEAWLERVRQTPANLPDWNLVKTTSLSIAEVVWGYWQGLVNFGVTEEVALALTLSYQSHLLGMGR